jgi:hypothetical protein
MIAEYPTEAIRLEALLGALTTGRTDQAHRQPAFSAESRLV